MHRVRNTIPMMIALGIGLGAMVLLNTQPASSFPADAKRVKWQYNTQKTDADALQPTLDGLGNEGWDVFSVVRANSTLDQNGGTHIRSSEYQVTSRRPAK